MSNIFTRPFCETPWGRAQGCPFFAPPPPRSLRLIIGYYVSNRNAEKPLGSYVSGFSAFWSLWEKSQERRS